MVLNAVRFNVGFHKLNFYEIAHWLICLKVCNYMLVGIVLRFDYQPPTPPPTSIVVSKVGVACNP